MGLAKIIVGVDEVGRGSWAGPLVAAAVILDGPIEGLKDSKLLSKNQREKLVEEIYERSMRVGVGWSEVETINAKGLTYAVTEAMSKAVDSLGQKYDELVIDGNYNYLPDYEKVTIVPKADSLVPTVSAASIVAKVYRDNWMKELSLKYPQYGFDKHVGYGTKLHLEMLKLYGPCSLHRMFYKPIMSLT